MEKGEKGIKKIVEKEEWKRGENLIYILHARKIDNGMRNILFIISLKERSFFSSLNYRWSGENLFELNNQFIIYYLLSYCQM